MIELPQLPYIPGLVVPKKRVVIKIIGHSSWDKAAIRELFLYLYQKSTPSPLFTLHTSVRIEALPNYHSIAGESTVTERIWAEYIYWPTLKLSYLSYIYVSEILRRHDMASALMDYYLEDIRNHRVTDSYAISDSPEGLGFLTSKGYILMVELQPIVRGFMVPQPWFHKSI